MQIKRKGRRKDALFLQDVLALWEERFSDEAAAVILVGHSMGGAVAARIAATQVLLTNRRFSLEELSSPLEIEVCKNPLACIERIDARQRVCLATLASHCWVDHWCDTVLVIINAHRPYEFISDFVW